MREGSAAVASAKVLIPHVQSLARERVEDNSGLPPPHGAVARALSFDVLTEREIRVLKLVADGLDTAEVGRRLFFSERTIKNIIHGVTSRLNLRNRTQAVAYALRHGLI